MSIIKKFDYLVNNLKITSLIFIFSVFIFTSCNIFRHIPQEDTSNVEVKWDDDENEKPVKRNNNKNRNRNKDNNNDQNNIKNIDPDSVAGSGKNLLEEYDAVFGYELTGDENPDLIAEIADWLGTKYKYGGYTKEGVDCSGFVGNVYWNVFKIKLSRSSKDMINDVVTIDKENLENGDIIFFKINGKTISHVGIYISQNKFAHASSKRGVVINDLDETYYKEHFFTAGRVKK